MPSRTLGRAAVLAAVASLLTAGAAFADMVRADGDGVAAGVQQTVDLGTVPPGAVVERSVPFTIECTGSSHLEPGTIVTLAVDAVVAPEGGSATATDATAGPVPAGWPAPGTACPASGEPSFTGGTPAQVVLQAPAEGTNLEYTFVWLWLDGPGASAVTFVLDVANGDPGDTTPPSLAVPGDVTVLTSGPAAVVDYDLPAATDDTDPSPVVGCDPSPGSSFDLGATVVTCTATDASGNAASASFTVTVVQAGVAWDSPLGLGHPALVGNFGRTIPVKASLTVGTVVVTPVTGAAPLLRVEALDGCAASAAAVDAFDVGPMTWDGARWTWQLDTTPMGVGCWRLGLATEHGTVGAAVVQLSAGGVGQSGLRVANRPR